MRCRREREGRRERVDVFCSETFLCRDQHFANRLDGTVQYWFTSEEEGRFWSSGTFGDLRFIIVVSRIRAGLSRDVRGFRRGIFGVG